jgi:hypothetical protein
VDTNGSVKAKWSLGSVLFVENVLSTFRKSSNGNSADSPVEGSAKILQIRLVEPNLVSFTFKWMLKS